MHISIHSLSLSFSPSLSLLLSSFPTYPSPSLSLFLPLSQDGEDSPGMKRVSSAPNVRYYDSLDDEGKLDTVVELVEAVLLRDNEAK